MNIANAEAAMIAPLGTAKVSATRYDKNTKSAAIASVINNIFMQEKLDEFFITTHGIPVIDGKAELPENYLVHSLTGSGLRRVKQEEFENDTGGENIWTVKRDDDGIEKYFFNFAITEVSARYIKKFVLDTENTAEQKIPLRAYWDEAIIYLAAEKVLYDDQQYEAAAAVGNKAKDYLYKALIVAQEEETGEEGYCMGWED